MLSGGIANICPVLEGQVVHAIVEGEYTCTPTGKQVRALSIRAYPKSGKVPQPGHIFNGDLQGSGEYSTMSGPLQGRDVDPGYVAGSEIVSVISTSKPSRGIPVRGEPGCFSVIITGKSAKGTYVLEYYGSDDTEIGAIEWMKPG